MGFIANFIHFQQCKHFENRLRFDKVTESSKVGTFLRHRVGPKSTLQILATANKLRYTFIARRSHSYQKLFGYIPLSSKSGQWISDLWFVVRRSISITAINICIRTLFIII